METLKEIRTRLGLSQSDIARQLHTTIPAVCNYENNQTLPPVEDMILLERSFSQRLQWNENLSALDKQETIRGLTTLMEKYPVSSVLIFAQKALREGQRMGHPAGLIKFYANAACGFDEEPLPPIGVKFKNEKQ